MSVVYGEYIAGQLISTLFKMKLFCNKEKYYYTAHEVCMFAHRLVFV